MDIDFKTAQAADCEKLTSISIRAFHTDYQMAGRRSIGGPPGYDDVVFHEQMIKQASRFYKVVKAEEIIGGFWFSTKWPDQACLNRIFIAPPYHRSGVGRNCFSFLFSNFPYIRTWNLKVPLWNTRTPAFYESVGFKIVSQSDRFVYFARSRNP